MPRDPGFACAEPPTPDGRTRADTHEPTRGRREAHEQTQGGQNRAEAHKRKQRSNPRQRTRHVHPATAVPQALSAPGSRDAPSGQTRQPHAPRALRRQPASASATHHARPDAAARAPAAPHAAPPRRSASATHDAAQTRARTRHPKRAAGPQHSSHAPQPATEHPESATTHAMRRPP